MKQVSIFVLALNKIFPDLIISNNEPLLKKQAILKMQVIII
jgi:hypothetical protein